MDSNEYVIAGRIVVRDSSTPGATSAQRNLQAVEDKARSVGWNIQGFLGRAFAVMGGGALVGGAVRGLVGLNSEIETARGGLATLYSAISGVPISEGLKLARGELKALQADARAGVGELSNYIEGYSKILGPGLNAGVSLDFMRELNKNALAAGAALRGDQGLWMAPMDLTQALTGGVQEKQTPIVAAALSAAGIGFDKFNAMNAADKFQALNEAFKAFAPGVALMGKSWAAQSSTFNDNIKETIRIVTAPLFNRWTDGLRRANEWIDAHRDTLVDIADTWGARILRIWDHVISSARTYLGLLVAAAAVQAAPTVIGAARGVGGALGRAGGAARGFMADPFGFASVFAGVGGGANAVAGPGMMAALRGALAGFSRLAGPIALVATLAVSAYSALAEFPSLLGFLAESGRYVVESFSGLADAFGTLTQSGSALNYVGGALVMTFGGLGYVLGGLVRVVGTFAIGLGVVFGILGEGMSIVYNAMNGNGSAVSNGTDRMAALLVNAQDQMGELWFGKGNSGIQGEQFGKPGELPTLPGEIPKPPNINIGTVNMNLKTEINPDPARIMVAWEEGADRLSRFKTSARRSDDV